MTSQARRLTKRSKDRRECDAKFARRFPAASRQPNHFAEVFVFGIEALVYGAQSLDGAVEGVDSFVSLRQRQFEATDLGLLGLQFVAQPDQLHAQLIVSSFQFGAGLERPGHGPQAKAPTGGLTTIFLSFCKTDSVVRSRIESSR